MAKKNLEIYRGGGQLAIGGVRVNYWVMDTQKDSVSKAM